MNKLTKTFLERRGYDTQYLAELEDDTHLVLKGTDEMVSMLRELHDCQHHITLVTDFDCDGIMSGVIGMAGLNELGFSCVNLHPCDPKRGYGFDEKDIEEVVAADSEVVAIITSDVGITCHAGVSKAKDEGLQVLVTDHHVPSEKVVEADVIVDPLQEGDDYELKGICGAYVLWQVLMSYAEKYESMYVQEQIRRLRVFAGIGTVSDVMPLQHENRELVRDAVTICKLLCNTNEAGECFFLQHIEGNVYYKSAFMGLFLLLQKFLKDGYLGSGDNVSATFFAFNLAPLINSVKRMDANVAGFFQLFFGTQEKQKKGVEWVWELNEKRREIVKAKMRELRETDQPYAPYIYETTDAGGFCGLLANKILRTTGPVLVVMKDVDGSYSGSSRSTDWYDVRSRLISQGFYAAGHEQACGVRFENEDELKRAYEFLKQDTQDVLEQLLKDNPDAFVTQADIVISTRDGEGVDSLVDVPSLFEFVYDISRLEPFGKGFEAPSIEFKFAPTDGEWKLFGSERQHLKFVVGCFEAVMWNEADNLARAQQMDMCTISGHLEASVWKQTDWETGGVKSNTKIQFIGTLEGVE